MAKSRIYIIDPEKKEIRESEMETEKYEELNAIIGCRVFTVATYLDNGDVIFVDDEGLLHDKPKFFFKVKSYEHQCFCGIGVVNGSDKEGGQKDAASSIVYLTENIEFLGNIPF